MQGFVVGKRRENHDFRVGKRRFIVSSVAALFHLTTAIRKIYILPKYIQTVTCGTYNFQKKHSTY
jgi:hypothetical protein